MDIMRHDGRKIDHAEAKLLVFHCIDVVEKYDKCVPPVPSRITEEDIRLANVIGARFGRKYWPNLVGKDISAIPQDVDLILISDQEWISYQETIRGILQPLLDCPGGGLCGSNQGLTP